MVRKTNPNFNYKKNVESISYRSDHALGRAINTDKSRNSFESGSAAKPLVLDVKWF